jgi:hypothetical protein
MMKLFSNKILLVLLVVFKINTSVAQSDSLSKPSNRLIEKFNNIFKEDENNVSKPKFFVYPTFAYTPETKVEVGLSALNLFYAKKDTSNRLSEVQSFSFVTFNKQYGSYIEHFIYSDKDRWFFLGKLKAQKFPLDYYGIGANTKKADQQLIESSYIAVRERVLRRISDNFFGGLEFDYQKVAKTSIKHPKTDISTIPGIKGSRSVAFGLGIVYDNRHNALNVRKGYFAEVANLNYSKKLGNSFVFNNTMIDLRFFKTTRKNQVLAGQFYGQFVTGNPPFNMMALLGSENLMRGYYYGRYRDKNYLAAQVEYRFLPFPFSKRIGGVTYLSTGSVFDTMANFDPKKLLPAGGVGLRYLIFPKKDIFLRFDIGFTKERVGFYINTGEAF